MRCLTLICLVLICCGCSRKPASELPELEAQAPQSADEFRDGIDRTEWSSFTNPQFNFGVLTETLAHLENKVAALREAEQVDPKVVWSFDDDPELAYVARTRVKWSLAADLDDETNLPVVRGKEFALGDQGRVIIRLEPEIARRGSRFEVENFAGFQPGDELPVLAQIKSLTLTKQVNGQALIEIVLVDASVEPAP